MKQFASALFALALLALPVEAREIVSLNEGWGFAKKVIRPYGVFPNWFMPKTDEVVNLPHTWNATDFMNDEGYYRGVGSYVKDMEIPEAYRGKRLFLRFEGAGTVADVFINGNHVGEHRGAYNSFVFEITPHVVYGTKNNITVICDNSSRFDTAPTGGDFNLYGGLYRDVWMEVLEETCISPLYYGSNGLLVSQQMVSPTHVELSAEIHLSTSSNYTGCQLAFNVYDAEGNKVAQVVKPYVYQDKSVCRVGLDHPHLWNGVEDPYLYKVEAVLTREGKELDRVEDHIGIRTFHVDADKGFFLNGKHLKLRGVSRHQDHAVKASALTREDHLKDFSFFEEMGVNSLRLAHYPQAKFMFQESDRRGYVVWEEIPFVGSYIESETFDEHLKTQLKEMIIQNYNHPSICFWGLFNEIHGERFTPIVAELNHLAHQLDPYRLTTSATDQEGTYNFVCDVMAWNKYFGWYQGVVTDFGPFFDEWHKAHPDNKICISEYGSGAAFSIHVGQYVDIESENRKNSRGHFHPMEKQTYSHRLHLEMITERDYLWGSYVWNMFDFASALRREGDTNNLNDKGLVSQDRTRRKDAFYLYKANWNKKVPTVHLCSKEYTDRKEDVTDIFVFTTAPSAKLYLNGKLVGQRKTDAYATCEWKGVKLQPGVNKVEVRTNQGNDAAEWIVK